MKSQFIGNDRDAGKDSRQEEKGTTEDEMGFYVITNLMDMSLSKLWVLVIGREAWSAAIYGVTKSRTHLNN